MAKLCHKGNTGQTESNSSRKRNRSQWQSRIFYSTLILKRDGSTFMIADVTTEVCDGLPLNVEKSLITSDRYCPWSAEVIALDE
jgi:hypothetical protein